MAAFSLLCALLIVTLHVDAHFGAGSTGLFVFRIIRGCASIAVPYFCIASGFFLAGKMGGVHWWKDAVVKRVKSLLVPFLIWNALAWSFYLLFSLMAGMFGMSFGMEFVQNMSWSKVATYLGLNLFEYPIHGYYWYVRMLFVFVLIAPAFLFCRSRILGAVVVLFFLSVLIWFNRVRGDGVWSFFFEWTIPIRCIVFFGVGIWLRYNLIQCRKCFCLVILGVGVGLLMWYGLCENLCPELTLLMTIALLFGLWGVFDLHLPEVVTACSFMIYTLHWFVVRIMHVVLKISGQEGLANSNLSCYLVHLIVVEILTLAVAVGLKKLSPRLSVVVFGR